MKHGVIVLLALGLASAPIARAAGLNLAWDRCRGDSPVELVRTFACDDNQGSDVFVGSFILGTPAPTASIVEMVYDIHSASGGLLPAWWDLRSQSSCRGQLFADGVLPALAASCQSWVPSGPRVVIIRYDYQLDAPDHAKLVVTARPTPLQALSLAAGVEYLGSRVLLSRVGAAPPGSCGGCLEPASITLSEVRVANPEQILTAPAAGNVVFWQSAGPTPARRTSWGAVKALFH